MSLMPSTWRSPASNEMTETVSSFTSIPPCSPVITISSMSSNGSELDSEVSGARSSSGSGSPSGWSSTSLTSSVADSTASSAGVVFGGVSSWANDAKPNSSVAMKHARRATPTERRTAAEARRGFPEARIKVPAAFPQTLEFGRPRRSADLPALTGPGLELVDASPEPS